MKIPLRAAMKIPASGKPALESFILDYFRKQSQTFWSMLLCCIYLLWYIINDNYYKTPQLAR